MYRTGGSIQFVQFPWHKKLSTYRPYSMSALSPCRTPQCFLAHNVLFPVRWFHQRTHPPHSIFSFRHCEVWLPTVSIALAVRSTDTMIKSLGLPIAIICALASLTNAFNTTPMQCTIMSRRHGSPSSLSMIFGPPKDDGKPGDYVCKVNALVFTTLILYKGCIRLWLLSHWFGILLIFSLFKDCGYVFTKGPEAWAKLPEKVRATFYDSLYTCFVFV